MLAWSESDPTFVQTPVLDETFEQETTTEEYEKKIVALFKDAYRTTVASTPDGKETIRAAYKTLAYGDHYILIMLREALGLRLQPWWPLKRLTTPCSGRA
jgi:hypothetical protein